ncbi:CoA transferase [Aurantivibrio plasticivorans]
MPGLLSGLRVLDMSDYTGATTGSFLASLGAEVIRIERPGSASNHQTLIARRGKKSITLNLDDRNAIALFKGLIKKSDFLIETFRPGFLKSKGLSYEELSTINPQLIHVSITPFGQTGPYSQFLGGELVASAMGGTLATCGYPDDTPVLEALDACSFHACSAAAMGAMFAHRDRGLTGLGQHIDCSIQEVAASRNTNNLLSYQFDKRKLERAGNKVRFGVATVRVVWELADGYCFHSLMTGKFGAPANSALSRWMTEEGYENPMADVNWDTYDRSALPADTRLIWETAIAAFFKSKTKAQIRNEGHQRGIRATVANDPTDVMNDDHLNARDFIRSVEMPNAGAIQLPDYFVRLSNSDFRNPANIPSLGKDNTEVFSQLLDIGASELANLHAKGVI